MAGVFGEQVGEDRFGDGGEGAEAFEVAGTTAVADGEKARGVGDALVGDENVAEFAAEAAGSADDAAFDDDAAAEAGADNGGNRGLRGGVAEEDEVAPEGSGVAVVEVRNGLAEFGLKVGADVEAGPIGVDEVGGAFGAKDAVGASGAGGVEADYFDVKKGDAGVVGGELEAVGDLLEADGRAFAGESGVFEQGVDEEVGVAVQEGVVNGGSAEVDSSREFHMLRVGDLGGGSQLEVLGGLFFDVGNAFLVLEGDGQQFLDAVAEFANAVA